MSKKEKQLDTLISNAWQKLASGVQVNILDIPKIFREVKTELAGGVSLEDAVISLRDKYRLN